MVMVDTDVVLLRLRNNVRETFSKPFIAKNVGSVTLRLATCKRTNLDSPLLLLRCCCCCLPAMLPTTESQKEDAPATLFVEEIFSRAKTRDERVMSPSSFL
jgi:hypothetical protein